MEIKKEKLPINESLCKKLYHLCEFSNLKLKFISGVIFRIENMKVYVIISVRRFNMKMNMIVVYNQVEDKILMCLRSKNPYKELYNLVGGKIEKSEEGIDSAYRELEEETGITKEDIILTHLMNFEYYMSNIELQVYVGKLNKNLQVVEEVNKLYWVNVDENFFDMNKYAGEGNIGHIIEQVNIYKKRLLLTKEEVAN